MRIVAHNRNDALRFIDRVCGDLGPTWEPPQSVEIKRFKPPRSLGQNDRLHAVIRDFARWAGHSESEMKDILKDHCGLKKRYTFGEIDKMIPMSTTQYTRDEMSDFIVQIEQLGAELGVEFSHE